MGNTAGDPVLEIDYPMAFATAFRATLSGTERESRFQYVHISGKYAESDQEKDIWYKKDLRKIKVHMIWSTARCSGC